MSKGKIVQAEFGGEGPRQVLGEVLKQVDRYRAVFVVTITEDGETEVWANAITKADLALIAIRTQGHALIGVNDWD